MYILFAAADCDTRIFKFGNVSKNVGYLSELSVICTSRLNCSSFISASWNCCVSCFAEGHVWVLLVSQSEILIFSDHRPQCQWKQIVKLSVMQRKKSNWDMPRLPERAWRWHLPLEYLHRWPARSESLLWPRVKLFGCVKCSPNHSARTCHLTITSFAIRWVLEKLQDYFYSFILHNTVGRED